MSSSVSFYHGYHTSKSNSERNSPLWARALQPTAGLTSTCPYIEAYNPKMACCQHVESPPPIFDFLARNCYYESVAIKVTHGAGLARTL